MAATSSNALNTTAFLNVIFGARGLSKPCPEVEAALERGEQMGPKTKELVEVLDELIPLLRENKADHWSNWMTEAKKRLTASDYSGIEKVLSAYGGMGSFNDLVLGTHEENGTPHQLPQYWEINEQLSSLRTRAGELADEIRQAQG